MKRLRRDRKVWYRPPSPPAVAVFQCRRCHAVLTRPLALLTDASTLSREEGTSLLPAGHFWKVAAGEEFVDEFAVPLDGLIGVGYHPDRQRLIGCCGPSGTHGRNRVCVCGREVGTERSDCIWPHAVYLDASEVLVVSQDSDGGS